MRKLCFVDRVTSVKKDDFFPTPPDCTHGLMQAERYMLQDFQGIWEPACGDGAISEVLMAYQKNVVSTDLVDRGYEKAKTRVDFLMEQKLRAKAIITNPPFKLADQFIRHAMGKLKADYLAMLLKATYFHADRRRSLFEEFTPARIYALAWRPDFTGGGGSPMDCCWFVWDNRSPAKGQYRVMGRV